MPAEDDPRRAYFPRQRGDVVGCALEAVQTNMVGGHFGGVLHPAHTHTG
jgi:hypothetical protein